MIISFKLDLEEKISIHIDEEAFNSIGCCSISKVFFHQKNIKYKLFHDLTLFTLEKFSFFLEQALTSKLLLHESITQDIGYLWNQELQDKPGLTYQYKEGIKKWVGIDNHLWSTRSKDTLKLASWLYNDNNKNIIFEITPTYPWYLCEENYARNKFQSYIPYEEWIKNYKPLLIRIIPREIAQQWLNQAQEILKKSKTQKLRAI